MDLIDYLYRQIEWSERTFGSGERTEGLIDHIIKELDEIYYCSNDLDEWIDVIILALDGAWRVGYTPEQIAKQLEIKLEVNKNRKWPDWKTAESGKAIEHIREEE